MPGGDGRPGCERAARQGIVWSVLARSVPGPAGAAALARQMHQYSAYAAQPSKPTELVNFGEAVNFPLLFGIMLSLFGAATMVHLLLVSVARRRRETGLLKVLGFRPPSGGRGGLLAGDDHRGDRGDSGRAPGPRSRPVRLARVRHELRRGAGRRVVPSLVIAALAVAVLVAANALAARASAAGRAIPAGPAAPGGMTSSVASWLRGVTAMAGEAAGGN